MPASVYGLSFRAYSLMDGLQLWLHLFSVVAWSQGPARHRRSSLKVLQAYFDQRSVGAG